MSTTFHKLYQKSDEPVTIRFVEIKTKDMERHDYSVTEPEAMAGRKRGVTTALNIINKPELIQWASNKAVEAFRIAYKANPTWTEAEFKAICAAARYAHRSLKEEAALVGSDVHNWIEAHLNGVDNEISAAMKPSVRGYLNWEKAIKPKTHSSERVVYSKQHDYCGKVDWIGEIDDRYGIIDFKTGSFDKEYNSSKRDYTGLIRARPSHFAQEGAYDIAVEEEDGVAAKFYGVLYIQLDGTVEYFEVTDTADYRKLFVQALELGQLWNGIQRGSEYREPTKVIKEKK